MPLSQPPKGVGFPDPLSGTLNGQQPKGKNAELCLVLDNRVDEFRSDSLLAGGKSVDQCSVAKNIDRAWNSAARVGNDLARSIGEQRRARSHGPETKVNVFTDLMSIQRSEVKVR